MAEGQAVRQAGLLDERLHERKAVDYRFDVNSLGKIGNDGLVLFNDAETSRVPEFFDQVVLEPVRDSYGEFVIGHGNK